MSTESMYRQLLQPSHELVADIEKLSGDIMILGAGGKMGPDLARLARAAIDLAGVKKEVFAVSRFSDGDVAAQLESSGVRVHRADLLDDRQLQNVPEVDNVLYLAGTKFGTSGNEPFTWAMNAYLPGRVAEKFKNASIVVFSTGNVYPLTSVSSGGATENHPTGPVGEYAQSCLGRERVFQYFSSKNNTPALIYRLNYANDVTYGVLSDIARAVMTGRPINLAMGYVNIIWQADANEIALRALHHCAAPARVLNVTGPETTSVRWIAGAFGSRFGVEPVFEGEELPTALLSNASECVRLFGPPRVNVEQMVDVVAGWLKEGRKTLDKPTHFQERDGKF